MIRILFFLFCVSLSGCLTVGNTYNRVPPGIWRGVLVLETEEIAEEKSNAELPFNFEVVYTTPDSFHLVIHNGTERIVVNDIKMGVDRRTARDTMWIDFPMYDSHIRAQYEEDAIEGVWVVRNRKDYQIPFKSLHGQSYRFFQKPDEPVADISGNWECIIGIDGENPDTTIGVFKQNGTTLTGTFLSKTGDYRYLEGNVSGDRMFLSVFDGSHAYLFEARILEDGTLTGIYRSGNHYKTYWSGKRTTSESLTELEDPFNQVRFSPTLPVVINRKSTDGRIINTADSPYKNKPLLIQLMGTWCPNCHDETEFLLDYLKTHPDPGFEIIGISFERQKDTARAIQVIEINREKMGIPYPIIYAGLNDKKLAKELFPQLEQVIAFPTLLFIGSDGIIRNVHSGFSGPATPDHENFKSQFDSYIANLTERNE